MPLLLNGGYPIHHLVENISSLLSLDAEMANLIQTPLTVEPPLNLALPLSITKRRRLQCQVMMSKEKQEKEQSTTSQSDVPSMSCWWDVPGCGGAAMSNVECRIARHHFVNQRRYA
jgi:hypothetical protein